MQGESFWKAIHTAEESLSRETMKHSSTQPVARKNPDSPRVHGLRLTVDSSPLKPGSQTGNSSRSKQSPQVERFGLPSAGGYDL